MENTNGTSQMELCFSTLLVWFRSWDVEEYHKKKKKKKKKKKNQIAIIGILQCINFQIVVNSVQFGGTLHAQKFALCA